MAPKEKDLLRDIMEKLETPQIRWALVLVGVVILLRLKLALFAAALPVMAYWHYSQQPEEDKEQQADGEFDNQGSAETRQFEDEFDEDDDGFGRDEPVKHPAKQSEEMDPYGEDFWGGDAPGRSAPRTDPASKSSRFADDDDDDFGFGADRREKAPATKNSWDDDPSGRPLDDDIIPGLKDTMGGMGGFGLGSDDFLGGFGKEDDGLSFDPTFGLGGGGDMDFLTESMGSGFGRGGGGKGKGKGKKGDKDGKGEKGPRENDPKQLFVAGVGDLSEDELRDFFEEKGQVSRLKVLRDDSGESKGVCFVTFATEEQAQDALQLHGSMLPGLSRGITVRPAGQNNNKGDKGGKGDRDNKGGKDRDRPDRRDRDRGMDGDSPFGGGGGFGGSDRIGGGSDRFGGLGDDREPRSKGGGGKGKGGNRRNERSELDELIEEELASQDVVRAGDFDFASRRFLGELRKRDKSDGTDRFHEALRHVLQFTGSKDRGAVRKWTAYVYKLLCTFDQDLADSLRSRDSERKGGGRGRDDD